MPEKECCSIRRDFQEPPYADPHVRWGGSPEGNPPGDQIKRADAHLFPVAVGGAFVLGIVHETLSTWFTVWMRDARAFGLGRGGRTNVAKSSEMTASNAGIPRCGFLFLTCATLLRFANTFNVTLSGAPPMIQEVEQRRSRRVRSSKS